MLLISYPLRTALQYCDFWYLAPTDRALTTFDANGKCVIPTSSLIDEVHCEASSIMMFNLATRHTGIITHGKQPQSVIDGDVHSEVSIMMVNPATCRNARQMETEAVHLCVQIVSTTVQN